MGTAMQAITVDDEFRRLCPALSPTERATLQESIAADGLRDAIVTWGGVVVDGHNRLEICKELGIEPKTVSIALGSREAAKLWILKNQFGRRNLTRIQIGYLRGKYYQQVKTTKPGRKPNGVSPVCVGENKQVSDIVGKLFNVARFVIENDSRLATAIDSLEPSVRDVVLSGSIAGHAAYIRQLAAIPVEDQVEIVEQVKTEAKPGAIGDKLKEWRDAGGIAFTQCPACFAAVAVGERCDKCLSRKKDSEKAASTRAAKKKTATSQGIAKGEPATAADLEVVRIAHAIMQWLDITPRTKAKEIHFATLGRLQRELAAWMEDD